MLEPRDLYTLEQTLEPGAAPDGPVLVEAIDGFLDVAGAVRLAREHLLETLEHRVVASFDLDQVLDYRARRPRLLFDSDHWASYDPPVLALHAVRDAVGVEFLLLAGPEPDYQWDRFVAAVRGLVEQLGVRLTIGINAIPMGVPHTRPLGMTVHGTRKDLLEGYQPWFATVQVPGSAGSLLEFRLGEAGHDAMGFAVHVPQYLAQTDFPTAAIGLLEGVARVGGLVLPTDALRAAADVARQGIDEQVAASSEIAEVVRGLEQQYDAFVAARGRPGLLTEAGPLPTADELGAQLERFLAEQTGPTDPPDPRAG